jgi:DNA-binding PadR family transcriptional regulator
VKKLTAFQAEILVKIARAKGQRIRPYGLLIRTCKNLESRGLIVSVAADEYGFKAYQITDAGRKVAEDLIRAMGTAE